MVGARVARPRSTTDDAELARRGRCGAPSLSPFRRPARKQASSAARTVFFLLFASSCGGDHAAFVSTNDDGERLAAPIIGGALTSEGDFPAVVALGGCSGTLVHPRLVVYAEHCGTAITEVRFGPSADAPNRVVTTDRCRGFPGAKLGDGTDLAYCVLEESVVEVEPERVLTGCELADSEVGLPAVMVGYGIDRDGGAYGEQRVASSHVESIGDELFLERGQADTCRGDSGGPVFVERVDPDGTRHRRLVGVTSAGTESECGRGIGHYVNVTRKLEWLEQSSELDLTPCFEGDAWSPTARCGFASCGEPFDLPRDERPPSVAIASPAEPRAHFPLPAGAPFVEFELVVDASDDEWGVEHVSLSLFGEDGALLFDRVDEIAPYGLSLLRVPPGTFTLEAEARDYAGNTQSTSLMLQVGDSAATQWFLAGGACAWSGGPFATNHAPFYAAFGLVLALRQRRRIRQNARNSAVAGSLPPLATM
jgi:V8-like Glu-specific endopeptidase